MTTAILTGLGLVFLYLLLSSYRQRGKIDERLKSAQDNLAAQQAANAEMLKPTQPATTVDNLTKGTF